MVLSWLVAVTTPFSMGMSFLNSTLFMMTAMVLLPGLICWFSAQKLSTWFALPGESGGGSVSFEQWEILGIRLLGLYFFIHGLLSICGFRFFHHWSPSFAVSPWLFALRDLPG
jgi:hypothetical protein